MASTSPASSEFKELLELANSWRIPNGTRQAVDEIETWIDEHELWARHFSLLPQPRTGSGIVQFRDGLREMLRTGSSTIVERFLRDVPPRLSLENGRLVSRPFDECDAVAVATMLLVRAAVNGTLPRLRTCPDCGWAFYDSSRNGKRVWCAMVGAPDGGRGCGSAAKTRAYRERRSNTLPS